MNQRSLLQRKISQG